MPYSVFVDFANFYRCESHPARGGPQAACLRLLPRLRQRFGADADVHLVVSDACKCKVGEGLLEKVAGRNASSNEAAANIITVPLSHDSHKHGGERVDDTVFRKALKTFMLGGAGGSSAAASSGHDTNNAPPSCRIAILSNDNFRDMFSRPQLVARSRAESLFERAADEATSRRTGKTWVASNADLEVLMREWRYEFAVDSSGEIEFFPAGGEGDNNLLKTYWLAEMEASLYRRRGTSDYSASSGHETESLARDLRRAEAALIAREATLKAREAERQCLIEDLREVLRKYEHAAPGTVPHPPPSESSTGNTVGGGSGDLRVETCDEPQSSSGVTTRSATANTGLVSKAAPPGGRSSGTTQGGPATPVQMPAQPSSRQKPPSGKNALPVTPVPAAVATEGASSSSSSRSGSRAGVGDNDDGGAGPPDGLQGSAANSAAKTRHPRLIPFPRDAARGSADPTPPSEARAALNASPTGKNKKKKKSEVMVDGQGRIMGPGGEPNSDEICWDWKYKGKCVRGAKCNYVHADPVGG